MGRDHKADKHQDLTKADRAKLARETINKTIPIILASSPRARAGVDSVAVIQDLPPNPRDAQSPDGKPLIRVVESDTLDAAHSLRCNESSTNRIAILSMASPLSPGGGVLNGATSQEESLCMRTTLYSSLRDTFYRIPENALIYTKDVMVFRTSDMEMIDKSDRWFVDVLSCPALRFPELNEAGDRYAHDSDRELTLKKIQLIVRAAVSKGASKLVLGALGCGAYSNPAIEVAELFRRVLLGNPKRKDQVLEGWGSLNEIVCAIKGSHMLLKTFEDVFGTS